MVISHSFTCVVFDAGLCRFMEGSELSSAFGLVSSAIIVLKRSVNAETQLNISVSSGP